MNSAALTIDDYLTAFRARREVCRALLELSREQQQLIDADDYDELVTVLQMKQNLVDELLGGVDAPWKMWKQQRAGLPVAGQHAGDVLLAETESLLLALLDEEQIGVSRLMTRRDVTERELTQITSAQQIQSAYHSTTVSGSQWGLDVNL
ncbi:MAG TPA: hypothetical protein VFG20_11450 [Planctomycetaceae bacterium]|nr:hypothetical protein [Planctomycetaceae bacterium]